MARSIWSRVWNAGTSVPIRSKPQRRKSRLRLEALEDRLNPAPALLSTIEGITFDENATNGGFYNIPPDPIGAAGPNHVVSVVNTSIEWHTKAGAQQNSQRLGRHANNSIVGSFFAPLTPANGLFDPKVIYDHFANRFVVTALEKVDTGSLTGNTSRMLVAVSDDSDPNGTWRYLSINSLMTIGGFETWADYPGFAVDEEAVYITNNMFRFNAGGSIGAGTRLWIIDKGISGGFYAGGAASFTVHDPYDPALTPGSIATTTQPAHMYSAGPGNTGTFLVSYSGLTSGGTEFVQIIRVDNPITSPTFSHQFVSVGDIDNTLAAMPDAPQSGTSTRVETNDRRALNAVWRNNQLWMTAQVVPGSGVDAGQATAHWWNLNTTTPAAITVTDQGNVGAEDLGAGTYTFMPSIAVDSVGNMGIGFAASNSTIFPGAYYTGRAVGDPAGSVQSTGTLAAGLDYYIRTFGGSRNRWGDYSGAVVSDGDHFWIFNQYADTRGTVFGGEDGRWRTRWGEFTFVTAVPTLSATLVGTELTIADIDVVGKNNNLTVSLVGTDLVISDSTESFAPAPPGGTRSNANRTLTIAAASVSKLTINTAGGTDTLTVNLAGGDAVPASGLFYNGGNPTTAPGDKLVITGGSQGTVTYNYTNANDGNIVMSNFGTVTYTGLEPITNSGTATDIIFNLPATGNVQAILEDDGVSNTLSRLRSSPAAFEQTDFANPTGSVTINRGSADDDLTVTALPDFNAGLTIGSGPAPLESITFGGAITLGTGKNLSGDAQTMLLLNSSTDLTTTGSGAIALTAASSILLNAGSSLVAGNGTITVSANSAGMATGDFIGVDVNGGIIQANGNVQITGRGGPSGTDNYGVWVRGGGSITSGTGTLQVTGTGGASSAGQSHVGVFVSGVGSAITSSGGNVQVTGTSAGTASLGTNYGVLLNSSGLISAGGNGSVTVNGTGGASTGNSNDGVAVSGGTISSSGGNVQVTGQGGGSGGLSSSNFGVIVQSAGQITAGGSGSVTVNGTGGATAGAANYGVRLQDASSKITSSGGNVQVTGTGGGASGSNGLHNGVVVQSGSQITSGGMGTVTVQGTGGSFGINNRGVIVGDANSRITTGGGNIQITGIGGAGSGSEAILLQALGEIVSAGSATVTVIGDSMNFSSSSLISGGSNLVTLQQRTAGTLINLGGADVLAGSPLTLGLTDAELDRVTGTKLTVGAGGAGTITVSAAITRAAGADLSLTTSADIAFGASGSLDSGPGGFATLNALFGSITTPAGVSAGTHVTASSITLDDEIRPGGSSAGQFVINGNLSLGSGDTFFAQLNGTTPGTGHDQIVSTSGNMGPRMLSVSASAVFALSSVFRIVDKQSAGAFGGVFTDALDQPLNEGAIITSGGNTFRISYSGGDGNDVTLTTIAPPTTEVTLSSGNVIVTDIDGGNTNDTLTLSLVNVSGQDRLRVNDPGNSVQATGGAIQVDGNTVDVPLSSITGNIQVNTLAGDDTLTLSMAGGDFIPAAGLSFAGGNPTLNPGDKLLITGGNQGTVTYNYTNSDTGNIVMSNFGTVSYTGLEAGVGGDGPIVNTGSAADVIFNLPTATSLSASLGDDPTAGNGLSRLSGGDFDRTTFANPTGSVTVNRGHASREFDVGTLPDLTASLTVGSSANPFLNVFFGGPLTLGADKNLAAFASNFVSFTTAAADLATSGAGTVTLSGQTGVAVSSGSVTAASGAVTLIGNNFFLDAVGSVTNSSSVTLRPHSAGFAVDLGNNTAGTLGITDAELDRISTGTINIGDANTGTITVSAAISHLGDDHFVVTTGRNIVFTSGWTTNAGNLTFSANQQAIPTSGNFIGVNISGAALTSTGSGNLSISGRGGDSSGGSQIGVRVAGGGSVTGGTGTVAVQGSGGSFGTLNHGVLLIDANSRITSTGGNVSVTGTGGGAAGGSGGQNHGVDVDTGATVSAGGGGTVTVVGTGGAASGDRNVGVVVVHSGALVTSSGGNVSVTGFGGGFAASTGKFNNGVTIDTDGTITAGGSGNVTIQGTAGSTAGGDNYGVAIGRVAAGTNDPSITSGGGNVSVTGTGGSGGGSNNIGVNVYNRGIITAGGTGTVTVHGTGGATGTLNHGVLVIDASSRIGGSGGGNVTATGVEGGGTSSFAVAAANGGSLAATGTSTTTLTVVGNSMDFSTGAPTINGTFTTLRQRTNGTAINLGGADAAGTLGLTDAELDRVTAPNGLTIGDASSGTMTVSSAITRPVISSFNLFTGANIVFGPSGSVDQNGGKVVLSATNGSIQTPAGISGPHVITAELSIDGIVAPGASPGQFVVTGGVVGLGAADRYRPELNGPTPGTQYDQIIVNGDKLIPFNATLDVQLGFAPLSGQQFIIVNNGVGSPIGSSALFKDTLGNTLNEGATFTVGATTFRISYVGGTGNDVVLTVQNQPTISIADFAANEGNSGTTAFTFNVTLSAASAQTITVNYSTADGTAQDGNPAGEDNDYVASSGTVTFNPGETSKPVTVLVNGDTTLESNETFFVNLSTPVNATINDGQAQGTINNEDNPPSISINDVAQAEGNSGQTAFAFTVSLSNPSTQMVSVSFNTADGTATLANNDYMINGGSVTFNPGETSKQVTVQVNGDITFEPNETFFVNLSAPLNATILDGQGQATITNDDFAEQLTINNVSQVEGNAGTTTFTFTVTLSPTSTQMVTVNYTTADASAEDDVPASDDNDYVAQNGTLTFLPGESTKQISITVNGDTVQEANETFAILLSGATNATIIDGLGTGTIVTDESAPIQPNNNFTFTPVTVANETGPGAGGAQLIFGPGVAHGLLFYLTQHNSTGVVQLKMAVDPARITHITNGGPSTPIAPLQTFVVDQMTIPLDPGEPAIGADFATIQNGNALGTYLQSDGKYRIVLPYRMNNASGPQTLVYAQIIVNGTTIESIQSRVSTGGQAPMFPMATNGRYIAYVANPGAPGSDLRLYDINTSSVISTGVTLGFGAGGIEVGGMSIDGNILAFASSEYSDSNPANRRDYNLDGDTLDRVIRWIDVTAPTVVHVGPTFDNDNVNNNLSQLYGSDGRYIAYTVDEVGSSLNNDTDATDRVILLYDTQTSAVVNGSGAVDPFASDPSQGIVSFKTRDGAEGLGSDFNGDGDSDDYQLRYFNQNTSTLVTTNITLEEHDVVSGNPTTIHSDAGGSGHTDGAIIGYRYQPGVNDAFNPNTAEIRFIRIIQGTAVPTISINDVFMNEGNSGTTSFTFTVSLSNSSNQTVTVNFQTTNGTATLADGDYLSNSGTVTFAAGETSKQVTITVNGDTKFEPNETFTVNLAGATNATILDGQGLGTIQNDDPQPSLSINDVSVTEGNAGSVTASFTISLSNPSSQTVTVNAATANNTALAPGDYTAVPATPVSFAPGQTTQTFTVQVQGDLLDEINESFFVNLSGAVNATILDGQGIGTITDDDPPPAISINDVSVTEGNTGTSNLTFTVSLSNPSSQTVSVNFATADGTALVSDNDYNSNSGTLNFSPGQLTRTITVVVNGDSKFELDETFSVNLSAATNATIADGAGVGTILNDDTQPTISITDATLAEGNSGTTSFSFIVSTSNPTSQTITVNFATVDGTAFVVDGDYISNSGMLTFMPAERSHTIVVLVNGDTKFEPNETFTVNLSGATNATIADGTGLGTILNDDNPPAISISDASVMEGNAGTASMVFTVSLSNASSSVVSVNFNTADGSATTADGDYQSNSGTVIFAAGQTSQTVTVLVNGDTKFEPTETFAVNLTTPTGGSIGDGTGVGTILNDDAQPAISVNDVTMLEGNGGPTAFMFTVSLSNGSAQTITVGFATSDGSATLADADYAANTGTLTFNAGQTSQTITVLINGDTKFEPAENFTVNLTGPTNATIADGIGLGTIQNDDAQPSITINDAAVLEGNAGQTPLVFTVSLSNASYLPVTVNYSTIDGLATVGDGDYQFASGTLTFNSGQTSQTITVLVNGDTKFEPTEPFTVNLTGPTNATITDGIGLGTIQNDDNQPTLSISDVSAAEGNAGTTSFLFTVSLSNASHQAITVNFATTDGSATLLDNDYQPLSGVLTFSPGQISQTITVLVNGDTTVEPDETFLVNLSGAANATIADGTGLGTIQNDDGQPTISIDDVSIAEGNTGTTAFVFTISLSNASSQPITVGFASADGSATTADADYQNAAGTVTFTPGQTSQTITVLVNGDTKFEPNETFTVNLSSPTNATIADGTGLGTILNEDNQPTISINSVAAPEGNSGAAAFVFTVSLSNTSSLPITVNYATADGSASVSDSDYQGGGGTVTFNPGQTSQTITVLVNGDTKFEPNETFTVTLSGATNATIANGTGTGTIQNDDAVPAISINNVSALEGNSGTIAFVFTLSLSNASSQAISVNYATADGSATLADTDYQNATGTASFAPGQMTQTITVLVNGDTKFESNETFTVNLSAATNAGIADGVGVGTIQNNDAQPAISISDASVLEGNSGPAALVFTVSLSNASDETVTVNYATADGSATLADNDYPNTTGTATFAAGQMIQTITVLVNGDTKFEANETLTVNLSSPMNATIVDGSGTGTILNDDTQPSISISDVFALEGNSGTTALTFTVSLPNASYETVTVNFATADGTATPSDGDYQSATGTVTFNPGQQTQTVTVWVNGDTKFEPNETFTVTLSAPTNATIANGTGTGTIQNDDAQPTISIGDATVLEGNSGTSALNFTVSLSNASSQTITVNFATADGSATLADGDYLSNTGAVTFSAGQTSQTVTVVVNGDTTFEPNETLAVNLTAATNATIADGAGVGSIVNDDAQPTISIGDAIVLEGGSGTSALNFTVSLSNPSSQAITVNFATANGTATLADNDYQNTTGTVTFAAGQLSQTISVLVNGDTKFEANETLNVNLSGAANAAIADGAGVGTIQNDDAQPTVSINDLTQVEGNSGTTALVFTLTLSNASSQSVTVGYATADGSATLADSDYQSGSGSVTFAAGQTTQTITVQVKGDTKFEIDETFLLNLTTASNASIADGQGEGTIINDDSQPTISISDVTLAESDAGTTAFIFTVTLSNASYQTITADYLTLDGTAQDGDIGEDNDYSGTSGTLTFAANQLTQTIVVTVNGDVVVEPDETFLVNLTNPQNATITDGQGVGTIVNDDAVDACDGTIELVGGVLTIHGTDDDDHITINRVGNGANAQIRVHASFIEEGNFEDFDASSITKIVVISCDGDDDVTVAGNVTIATTIDGGDGDDQVNAGGGDNIIRGGAGNDKLQGGAGNDVLIGGEGDDMLVGGSGRDLLIGGIGSDRLVGNEGDDILIAGSTDHDANDTALGDIMKEWTSGHSFPQRVNNLKNGSGGGAGGPMNGGTFLNALTVHDDDSVDYLTGSSGTDWFLYNFAGTGAKDKVTDLNGSESGPRLDI